MNVAAVLFDLDDTLIDSRGLLPLRRSRRWRDAVNALGETALFPGVSSMLLALESQQIKWAVVTNSVSYYAEAACARHGLNPCCLVCYHDVGRGKPDRRFCELALARLNCLPDATIGVGDSLDDVETFRRGGLAGSFLAAWSQHAMRSEAWDGALGEPADLLSLL